MIAAAVVAAAIPIVACTVQDKGEPDVPSPIPAIDNSAELHLPIADYAPSADEDKVIGQAAIVLTDTCARRFGVHYTVRSVSQPGILDGMDRRYGVVDVEEAARWGYTRPSTDVDDSEQWRPSGHEYEIVTGRTPTGTPTTARAADGTPVPKGGCAEQAWRRLRDDDGELVAMIQWLLNETWTHTRSDSRARAAEKSWIECMKQAGHDFHHRWDAAESVATAPPEEQQAMAMLDATCAQRVNYVGIWHAVDSAYQRRAIAQLGDRLTQAAAGHRDLVARAREIVGTG